MTTLGIRIPDEMQKTLDGICSLSKRSKTSIVKEILEDHLQDVHDYYMTLEAFDRHQKSGGKTTSLKDIKEENGL